MFAFTHTYIAHNMAYCKGATASWVADWRRTDDHNTMGLEDVRQQLDEDVDILGGGKWGNDVVNTTLNIHLNDAYEICCVWAATISDENAQQYDGYLCFSAAEIQSF